MRMYDLLMKKRDGGELSSEEISFMINGYIQNSIPDYQMSAMLMAIFFNGMTDRELADLTMTMSNSGDTIDVSEIQGFKVDKHSTGGVGDKTTLVLGPMVAACGIPVAKMSGRGLGHTGGTLDKLESIKGFSISLTPEQFISNVNDIKIAIVGQTANITPADKMLYALRDVTATVDSIPLIAASIMSKKLAVNSDGIVLDVKTGEGAFMTTLQGSIDLAKAMVAIGKNKDRKMAAVISDMSQPLGRAVGNALEVKEAIATLNGNGPDDLVELCVGLGSQMLLLSGTVNTQQEAEEKLRGVIAGKQALQKLKDMVGAQSGDVSYIDDPEKLPKASKCIEVKAPENGHVHALNALSVGNAAMLLGAGRLTKESDIDLAVGIVLNKKIGDAVKQGECLAVMHVNNEENVEKVREMMLEAYDIRSDAVSCEPLIKQIIK